MFSTHPHFKQADAAMEAEISEIIAQLTLEEKISMLAGARDGTGEAGNTISVKRLGIPSIRMADASVGVHWWIHDTTTFPATIALAASFDTELAAEYARAIARDCRAGGIHILLGPGVNLYRSPLCGRNFEYFGEDPFLSSHMAQAYIVALQAQGVCSTLKHYAVNNQEFDRNKVSSDLDERTLREIYLRTFEDAVKKAGVGAIMTAYNLVNGVHCSENEFLINKILKKEWGFDGLVMSDWVSVYDTLNTANAGLDLEMPFAQWFTKEKILPLLEKGQLKISVLDDKIRRILRLIKCFGWIDYDQFLELPDRKQKNAEISRKVAEESIVLLKNNGILPLERQKESVIAVLGPCSDPAVVCGGGSGYNPGWRTVSVVDGMREVFGAKTQILHARGIDAQIAFDSYTSSPFVLHDGTSGVKVMYFPNTELKGDPVLTRVEQGINNIWKDKPIIDGVDKKSFSIRYETNIDISQKKSVDFYFHLWDGAARLIVDGTTIFDCWGTEKFGDHSVSYFLLEGRHEIIYEFHNIRSWNSCCLGIDLEAKKAKEYEKALLWASVANTVVYCGGFDHRSEAEGADRTFAMPVDTEKLLLDVLARNRRVIVVLTAGGNVDMNRWHDSSTAILHAWYPGQEGGAAVAKIIAGDINPSGRLPISLEHKLEDRYSHASYHDTDKDFRVFYEEGIYCGYRGFDKSGIIPRYPFGFGLSYTQFAFRDLQLSRISIRQDQYVQVSCDIHNLGKRAGSEVCLLFIRMRKSQIPRAHKELKNFSKVHLEAGASKTICLKLDWADLAFYSLEAETWVVESGTIDILLGTSAGNIELEASILVEGSNVSY